MTGRPLSEAVVWLSAAFCGATTGQVMTGTPSTAPLDMFLSFFQTELSQDSCLFCFKQEFRKIICIFRTIEVFRETNPKLIHTYYDIRFLENWSGYFEGSRVACRRQWREEKAGGRGEEEVVSKRAI